MSFPSRFDTTSGFIYFFGWRNSFCGARQTCCAIGSIHFCKHVSLYLLSINTHVFIKGWNVQIL